LDQQFERPEALRATALERREDRGEESTIMPKRSYESGALVGFDIVVPSSSPSIGRPQPAAAAAPVEPDAPSSGGYEDTWYRTLRVMAGASHGDDVEREGGLGDVDEGIEVEDAAPAQCAVATVTQLPVGRATTSVAANDPPAAADDAPAPAVQASPDSYEDNWYQILKTRRAAGDAGL
jgi:hypothetical protein